MFTNKKIPAILQAITSDPTILSLISRDPTLDLSEPQLTKQIVSTGLYNLFGAGRIWRVFDNDDQIRYPSIIQMEVDDERSGGMFLCLSSDQIYYVDFGNRKLMVDNDPRLVGDFSIFRLGESSLYTWLVRTSINQTGLEDLKLMTGWYNWNPDDYRGVEFNYTSIKSDIDFTDLVNELDNSYYWLSGYLLHHDRKDELDQLTKNYQNMTSKMGNYRYLSAHTIN